MKRFRGGVHPPYSKITARKEIESARLPTNVVLPLQQHVGDPCEALVNKEDQVKVGQKVGDSSATISAPIHSSVSGVVKDISVHPSPVGEVLSILIESDGKDEWIKKEGIDPEKSSKEEILRKIRECGIVGLGGAAFPTHVKLSPPPEKKIDTVIINGVECEPYITADHRLILEQGKKILRGTKIIKRLLDAEKAIVAVEDNKKDAAQKLWSLRDDGIEIVTLKTRYPQGDERHLIKAVLNREVPAGGLPFDVGVVLQNVGTVKAIDDAVYEGTPLVERVLTVTGDVKKPKNLLVRIGTPFSELIEQCGGFASSVGKVISGGPMMGVAQWGDVPVIKGTTCILVLDEGKARGEEERTCIRCGRCVEACPMGLMPTMLATYAKKKRFDLCEKNYIWSCDECGCCAYICPSRIPLIQLIRYGKAEANRREKK
jgi:electron transport complex protein RnfC